MAVWYFTLIWPKALKDEARSNSTGLGEPTYVEKLIESRAESVINVRRVGKAACTLKVVMRQDASWSE